MSPFWKLQPPLNSVLKLALSNAIARNPPITQSPTHALARVLSLVATAAVQAQLAPGEQVDPLSPGRAGLKSEQVGISIVSEDASKDTHGPLGLVPGTPLHTNGGASQAFSGEPPPRRQPRRRLPWRQARVVPRISWHSPTPTTQVLP